MFSSKPEKKKISDKTAYMYEFESGEKAIAHSKTQAKELRPNAKGDPKKLGEVDPETSALIGGDTDNKTGLGL